MRLRKFFEYKNEYYWEISEEEYTKYWQDFKERTSLPEPLHFDEKERIYLKNIGLIVGWDYLRSNPGILFYSTEFKSPGIVYKGLDDWYLIGMGLTRDVRHYYKCDQWDGLIKFLDDFGIVKYDPYKI